MPYNDQVMGNSGMADRSSKPTAGTNLLLGIWVFVSPWVYGAAGNPNAWNSWIVGGLIALCALFRLSTPSGARGLAWINVVPWVYAYTASSGRFIFLYGIHAEEVSAPWGRSGVAFQVK